MIPFQPLGKNRIRQLAKLRQKKFRRLSGEYLISGMRAVSGALQAVSFRPKALIIQKERQDLLKKLPRLPQAIPYYRLGEDDFTRISPEAAPQGIALVAQRPQQIVTEQTPQNPVLIYLQEVNDPGNLGTIVRSASWFGFKEILLSPNSADPFSPKAVRASAGFISHCRIYEEVGLNMLLSLRKKKAYRLLATVAHGGAALQTFRPARNERFILLFGSEADGLSSALRKHSSKQLTITKSGDGESLNLAVSVALFLYQLSGGNPRP